MHVVCPRCQTSSPDVARYCRHCGLRLHRGATGILGAGHAAHPEPDTIPDEFRPVTGAADLHYTWESASGGRPLLGTETLQVILLNVGYDLVEVTLRVCGRDPSGQVVADITQEVPELPRARRVPVEVPSYELNAPLAALEVTLVSATFAPST